jgi:hypothetical protein
MDSSDIIHVAVLPPDAAEAECVRKAASIIDKDIYGTRLLLTGKIPKVVAQYSTLQEADSTVQRLRGLGLTVITCADGELRQPSHSFRTHTLNIGNNEITFRDKSGKSTRIEATEAFLILAGKVETRQDTEVKETKTKLNLPATLLTGGIPIRRRVVEKNTVTSIQTECFLRVYDKKSANSSIEVRQYEFDYGCLGIKIAPTSLANFSTLVKRIREAFPQAIFDDRLTGNYGTGLPSSAAWGKVDILCKLIYLFHQLSHNPDSR